VKSFWSRRRSYEVEGELRAQRPEPRSEFVTSLAEHVRSSRRPARAGIRVALAGALTVALLAALAPVGALGSASSAAKGVVSAAARVVGTHDRQATANSPAQDQYKKKKCPKGTKKKGKRCVKVKKKAKGARVARKGPRFTG
jgi:predicted lysophospholipase L1 biosynthesis ABC-type transport system permease subunit